MKLPHILYSIVLLGFTLGIWQGNLALWKDGTDQPILIYSLSAAALPEKDQQLLKEGIRMETIAELTARLEDYLS